MTSSFSKALITMNFPQMFRNMILNNVYSILSGLKVFDNKAGHNILSDLDSVQSKNNHILDNQWFPATYFVLSLTNSYGPGFEKFYECLFSSHSPHIAHVFSTHVCFQFKMMLYDFLAISIGNVFVK